MSIVKIGCGCWALVFLAAVCRFLMRYIPDNIEIPKAMLQESVDVTEVWYSFFDIWWFP